MQSGKGINPYEWEDEAQTQVTVWSHNCFLIQHVLYKVTDVSLNNSTWNHFIESTLVFWLN